MPIPTSIDDLSTTAASNSPSGSDAASDGDNFLRAHASFIALLRDKAPVSPTDYGADTTGVAKSTTALTTAVGSGSAKVSLGPGTYLIDPIAFSGKDNLTIEGAGIDATIISLASTGTALTFSNCQWLKISNLTVQLSGTAQGIASTVGIRLDTGSSNCEISRVKFVGFASDGLQLVGTSGTPLSGNKVLNCYFLGNGGKQLYGNYSNDFHIVGNQFGRLSGVTRATHGAYLDNCSAGTYQENFHWENAIGCLMTSSNFNRIIGNRFEENQNEGYYQNGGSYTKFIGNDLYANSAASSGASDGAYFVSAPYLVIDGNQAPIYNSTRHRWDINLDSGCTNANWGDNQLNNFNTSFGPLRVDGTAVATFASDNALTLTTASINSGTTYYIGPNGASTTEADAYSVANFRQTVMRLYGALTAAAGAGESWTITLRVNDSDAASTFTISGASATAGAAAVSTPAVLLAQGDRYSIKAVRTSGAAAANLRVSLIPAEY